MPKSYNGFLLKDKTIEAELDLYIKPQDKTIT